MPTCCPHCEKRSARGARSARSAVRCVCSGEPTTRSVPSRRRIAVGLVLAAALGLPLAAIAASRGSHAAPSFRRDVAPILQEKCQGCHRGGGIAPFAFATRRDVASRAKLIESMVESRLMPPWPPGPRSPHFVGEDTRRLSAAQRATIL